MGFEFKPAAAPPPATGGAYAKLPQFIGKLVLVVPYEDNVPSKFKDQQGRTQYQTRATVVPVQSGTWTNPKTGDEVEWEAGDVLDAYISNSRVRRQISEMHVPVLGRLLMDGKAFVLEPPTEEQIALAKKVLKDVELPDKTGESSADGEDDDTPPWER